MKHIMGIEYGRGATAVVVVNGGPALAPAVVKKMYPNFDWTTVVADAYDADLCAHDRFGDCFQIQKKIVAATPDEPHLMIGGDHSVNFGHFTALANKLPNEDLCLIYIDAHLDIHTPESSRTQASGAPHGTNIRALMGDGDARWLSLQTKRPALRPENIFYLGARSYEPAEINFVREHNIYMRSSADLQTPDDWVYAADEILHRLGTRPYVVSFDFDAIDPNIFPDVLVPEKNGLSVQAAEYFIRKFAPDAHSFEFVEYAPSGNAACTEIVKKFVGIVLNSD